jgi:hypothetical protein
MTTARDVQAAADLADINEETLLAACKATKADLESLDRKLKELQTSPEPPDVSVSDFFTPAEFRLLVARAVQWDAAQIRARMPKGSEEKQ